MAKKKNILSPPLTRAERVAAAQKKKKQKKQRLIIAGVAIVLLPILIWFGTRTPSAPLYVSVCRTFAELQTAYPETLRLNAVEQIDRVTRLFYTYTDPYGEQHSDLMECKFYFDPTTHQLNLESIQINRNPVDQNKVDAFNKTIPAIIASKRDIAMPPHIPDNDLIDLRQD